MSVLGPWQSSTRALLPILRFMIDDDHELTGLGIVLLAILIQDAMYFQSHGSYQPFSIRSLSDEALYSDAPREGRRE